MMRPRPVIGGRELAIDRPADCVLVGEGGRRKCWLRVEGTVPEGAADAVEQALAAPSAASPCPVRGVTCATLRWWRHRSPRPDALALAVVLQPAASGWILVHPSFPADRRKPLAMLLAEAWSRVAGSFGSAPLGAHRLMVHRLLDDGPCHPDGLRQGLEECLAQLVLQAYRDGAIAWL